MLAKKNRICLNKDFDQIFKTGQSFYGKNFGVKIFKNKLLDTRLGVLVSTKISKKAVERNLLKRRIKQFFSKEMLKFNNSYDVIIITLPGANKLSFSDIKSELMSLLKKSKIYQ